MLCKVPGRDLGSGLGFFKDMPSTRSRRLRVKGLCKTTGNISFKIIFLFGARLDWPLFREAETS